jgi:putative hydrolase of the HAD superfamily
MGGDVAVQDVAGHEVAEPGRGLLLDIGGVLVDTGLHLVARLAQREPAIRPLLDRIGGLGSERDELWQRVLRREVTDRAYWAQRAAEVGAALGETWDTRAMMERLYALPREEWLRADVVRLMADTRAAGLPLGALTNDMADFHGPDWVARQDYLRLFDVIVDASVTGVRKPDPRAFGAAARALGLPPGRIVFLDDMPWNVAAAAQAGLLAVRVPPGGPGPAVDTARDLLGLRPRVP